jgi:aspartate-semialdehyde dehydrogenase
MRLRPRSPGWVSLVTGSYRVAVVGATGAVGRSVLEVLGERSERFPVEELVPFASPRSKGAPVPFRGRDLPCHVLTDETIDGFDLVFSSAGSNVSLEWASKFADRGAIVIDKSSAFRRDKDVPLVVPEVNPMQVRLAVSEAGRRIIATPNCSTTQLVVVLKPLYDTVRIKRLVIATYQAVSGTGSRAKEELEMQSKALLAASEPNEHDIPSHGVYPHPIAFNVLPQAGNFVQGEDCTDEEEKLVSETRRILGDQDIRISATCVRVPVRTCHSEAVNVELYEALDAKLARQLLEDAPGIIVLDEPEAGSYPTPLQAAGKDDVFVGRIRNDPLNACTLDLWIVADNLRKGAATNAVQIAELLHQEGLLGTHTSVPQPTHV